MIEYNSEFDLAIFDKLQQLLRDLGESFQIHCCWKAGSALQLESRLNEYVAKHSCAFCQNYKSIDPAHEKTCIEHDYCTLTALLAEHQNSFEARCPAGATELVIPFYRHGICLGAVLCGPYRKAEDPADDLLTELSASRLKSLNNIIRSILKDTIGSAYSDQIKKSDDQRLENALDFIRKNFRKPITAADAAMQANLSRSRFLHVFPQECNKTFGEYLRELRIAESCKLLQKQSLSIAEIAIAVGFCSQSHFTSVFRKLKKQTPYEFRQQLFNKFDQSLKQ